MKKVCKHCGGVGSVAGPQHAITCQICDGACSLPITLRHLDKNILYLEDKRKPTHK